MLKITAALAIAVAVAFATSVDPTLPQNHSCGPSMGLAQHGPLPILNKTGWWYFVCNAHAEGFGEVDVYHAIVETWVVPTDGTAPREQLLGIHSISMPNAPAGKRYYNYHEVLDEPTMNWQRIPINVSSGKVNIRGGPNAWFVDAKVQSVQGPEYAFDASIYQGKKTVHIGHNKDTGCVNYIPGIEAAMDVYYWSTVGLELSGARIRLPGEHHYRKLTGTCHYDRQHKSGSTDSATLWKWGESSFYEDLPAGLEAFEGRHSVWWGLYIIVGNTPYLYNAHFGMKGVDDALVEYEDVSITILNSTYSAAYNATVTDDLLLTLPSAGGIAIRAKATVPEAINSITYNGDGIHNVRSRFLEAPCSYSVQRNGKWVDIGFGYMEIIIVPSNLI